MNNKYLTDKELEIYIEALKQVKKAHKIGLIERFQVYSHVRRWERLEPAKMRK